MSSEENDKPNPFTRPGFLVAAGVVALIVVCAIIVIIVNVTRDRPVPPPTSSPSMSQTPTVSVAADSDSVCGLDGVELSGTVTTAPAATWQYEGTIGYPTSPIYGPGDTDPSGFRYCFQHSPTGALFAAANAIAQSSATSTSDAWTQYVIANGPYRSQLLAQGTAPAPTEGSRSKIVGFRVLDYDGRTATIDLAVSVSTANGSSVVSGVYNLVWQDGDWKVSADTGTPLDVGPIPNVAGYTAWGE